MKRRTEVHRTADGAEIVYHVRSGPTPWLLLHAFGCDAAMWDEVVAALPGEPGILIPELRGHGDSTLGWCQPATDQWAADVLDIAVAEGISSPAIAGISMGGYTAMALAALAPELARGFAFISTHARADGDEALARRADGLAAIRRRGWRSFAAGLMASLLSETNPDFPRHRERLMGMFERAGDSGLATALLALAHRCDRRPTLGSIRVPTVTIVGDADLLTPPDSAREIAAAVPNAELVVLEGVAHMSVIEAPGDVAAAMASIDGL